MWDVLCNVDLCAAGIWDEKDSRFISLRIHLCLCIPRVESAMQATQKWLWCEKAEFPQELSNGDLDFDWPSEVRVWEKSKQSRTTMLLKSHLVRLSHIINVSSV